jgi:hypothetical protein
MIEKILHKNKLFALIVKDKYRKKIPSTANTCGSVEKNYERFLRAQPKI